MSQWPYRIREVAEGARSRARWVRAAATTDPPAGHPDDSFPPWAAWQRMTSQYPRLFHH